MDFKIKSFHCSKTELRIRLKSDIDSIKVLFEFTLHSGRKGRQNQFIFAFQRFLCTGIEFV